ncbi:MAG: hypothetical protein K0R29_2399 [Pseudobdellovibrio sp.]|jgi:hypothetical protein|nr:hypothetical protein [Pseudobdellovibrio sp.]
MQLDFSKVRIFSIKTEKFFLYYPFLFLALIPFELLFSDAATMASTDQFLRRLLVNVLFLDSTHVFLTYFVLMRLPELKTWAQDKKSLSSSWFYIRLILIFGILLFYFNYSWPEKDVPWELEIVTMIIAFMPIQHSMYQIRGLSLAYNAGVRSGLYSQTSSTEAIRPSLEKIKLSEVWEKAAFILFFAGIIGRRILQKRDNFITSSLTPENLTLAQWVMYALILAAGFAFVRSLLILGTREVGWSGKLIHFSRLIAYPLMSVSFIAANLISIFHGIDYYLVVKKMVNASQTTESERKLNLRVVNFTLIASGLLFTALSYWRYIYQNEPVIPSTLLFLNGFVAAISYLHYYLDRIIFRMRDPDARKIIAPLITAVPSVRS